MDQAVLDELMCDLNVVFGRVEATGRKTQGTIPKYLRMTINYSEKGKTKLTMYDYLEDIIVEDPNDMNGSAVTPAASDLFTVDEECDKLANHQCTVVLLLPFSLFSYRVTTFQFKQEANTILLCGLKIGGILI